MSEDLMTDDALSAPRTTGLKKRIGLSLAAVALIALVASLYVSHRMRPAVATRRPLPKVTFTSLLNPKQPYDLAQHRGKVVVLDFWGST